jgi:hypothetical protein
MKTIQSCLILALVALVFSANTFACTTIIVSGKATQDGRPILWKNCDTDNLNHRVLYSEHSGYPLLGVARNSSTNDNTASIWVGTNAAGFAIMNTLSYNLTVEGVSSRNGGLMRRALEVCATVDDFQHYLDTLPRPLKVEANFGVIDAVGGAAYFETSTHGYHKVDVNDPAVAPNGYLAYTNFSYTGFYDKGQGYIRFQTVQHQVAAVVPSKSFSPQWILNNLARTYYHSLMDVDFLSKQAVALFPAYVHDSDFIPRKSTASSTVIHGVKAGENPELTTMWAVLGYPPCSVAIPAWVKLGNDNSSLLMRHDDTYNAKICDWALALKATLYDVERGHGQEYLNIRKVFNAEGTGYMQLLAPVEKQVFDRTNPLITKWRQADALDVKEAKALTHSLADYVEQSWP